MKSLFIMVALLMAANMAWAGREGGGSFVDYDAMNLVRYSVKYLVPDVASVDDPFLNAHPENRALLMKVLGNISYQPKVRRYRNHLELRLDYDVKNQSIIILAAFFDEFRKGQLNSANIAKVEDLLLHEGAHFWGFNDDQAEDFAETLVTEPLINLFSNKLEDMCTNIKLVTDNRFDGPRGTACFDGLHKKYCSTGAFPFEAIVDYPSFSRNYDLIQNISREVEGCVYDSRDLSGASGGRASNLSSLLSGDVAKEYWDKMYHP